MNRWLRVCAGACLALSVLFASEHHGQVTFGGLPVPGATVTAARGTQQSVAITDQSGLYSFPDLPDGLLTVTVEMTGFSTMKQDVTIAADAPAAKWELKLLALDEMKAVAQAQVQVVATPAPAETKQAAPKELAQDASDGFLINGSSNNGAASPFAQLAAFGNNRNGAKGLYNGGIGMTLDNSALDAKPYSLTGQDTPKAAYDRLTGLVTLGGPLRIPYLLRNGPNFFIGYQWTRNNNATTQPGIVPTLAERSGTIGSTVIPPSLISPQALALLSLYPLPNFNGKSGYNYQTALVSPTHQDAMQTRLNKSLNPKDQVYGRFAFQNTRSDSPNLFGFLDKTESLGINTAANWSHRFSQRWLFNVGIQFSRLATHVTPNFDDKENVSGLAGITGNNQAPANWGPPSLIFSSGIASLSDAQSSFNRNQTSGLSYSMLWNRGVHSVSFGADFRRQEFNYRSQQDARGTFTFTGAATGNDFADFLQGIPDTSSIAFGNADKYFRQSVYDAYVTDDWRVSPELSLNAGVRWEYGAPITEQYGRLVNLNIAPGFAAVTPVVAGSSSNSLLHPDRRGLQPRVAIAWRPLSGSSLVVRSGYGVYYDTSVYQNIALQMAQQPPLSKSLSVQNSAQDPLTLANGFVASPSITGNTFAVDPNFRVGYAQTWNVAVQRDLPGSLLMTATYLGIKGTRGTQEFLPNTYPAGAVNPCPSCPTGFAYLTSNGNSTRESGQIQLRRRLHNGLTGTLQYTFSKSIDDDAALGGQGAATTTQSTQNAVAQTAPTTVGLANLVIAQNWLDLRAERSLSTFDQRHLVTFQLQYTTGMGMKAGMLATGWKGALLKEWTFVSQITAGSGLPETPLYLAAVQGTGVTGSLRPEYTGAPLYSTSGGLALNPAAYIAPLAGKWGNAGRDSITGPSQFSFSASLGRTFRLNDRFNLDLRVDSTNALNHVTFTTWNTTVNNAQFGLPAAANDMRSMQTTLRVRF